MICPLTVVSCKARKLRIIIFQKGVVEMQRVRNDAKWSRTDAKRHKLEIIRAACSKAQLRQMARRK